MREQAIHSLSELADFLGKRFVELVVQKHQVKHAVVGDYRLLYHAHEVDNPRHAERVCFFVGLCYF